MVDFEKKTKLGRGMSNHVCLPSHPAKSIRMKIRAKYFRVITIFASTTPLSTCVNRHLYSQQVVKKKNDIPHSADGLIFVDVVPYPQQFDSLHNNGSPYAYNESMTLLFFFLIIIFRFNRISGFHSMMIVLYHRHNISRIRITNILFKDKNFYQFN